MEARFGLFLWKEKGRCILKNRVILAFAVVVAASLLSFQSTAVATDATTNVAEVNGIAISKSDFDQEMNTVRERMARSGQTVAEEQLAGFQDNVLDSLINRELLSQESKKKGITIDEQVVTEKIESIKSRFPNDSDFKNALERMHLSEETLKAQIRKDLAINELVESSVASKISVSEEEIKAFYEGHPRAFVQPEQVKASHILIKVDAKADEAARADAKKQIEELQKRIEKGEDFATLAKEFSQCPSSAKGGDLGYFKRGQMVKPFEDAAFALKSGELSDVVETEYGYHIIKVVEKKPETVIPLDDIKERLSQHLKNEKIQKEFLIYLQGLKDKAQIKKYLHKD